MSGIEKLLIGTHTMLAALIAPEFMLDTTSTDFDGKPESRYLAQSIKDVTDHYSGSILDKKTIDILNMGQALLVVYGARFYSIRERRRAERAKPVASPPPTYQPQNPAQNQRPPEKADAPLPPNVAEIPGVGTVEFPPGHPLYNGGGQS